MVPIETKIEDCPKIEENLKPEMKLVNNFRIKFDEIKAGLSWLACLRFELS